MHPMLNIAVKAARRAGAIINRATQDLDLLTVQRKGNHDYVSEVDKMAEQAIVETLLEAYPEHAILAEEGGAQGKSEAQSEYLWIIDPLDGTTNFLHGFPQFAVSIGLQHKGVLTQAVVFDPTRNELYTATRGRGAYLNDRRLRVSKQIRLEDALIGTGFPYRDFSGLEAYLKIFQELITKAAGVRRPGAASLDLAYVAAGRYDGFWEAGLKSWDMAAGMLLIQEAGGLVTDFEGGENVLGSGNIVCGTPKVFAQLLNIIQAHGGGTPVS